MKYIAKDLQKSAALALEAGDSSQLMSFVNNHEATAFLWENREALEEANLMPPCIMLAYAAHNWNNHTTQGIYQELFELYQEDLNAISEECSRPPLLYRGVAGVENRHELGFSWTSSKAVAETFAKRLELPNPSIITAQFDWSEFLFYTNARNEQEYVMFGENLLSGESLNFGDTPK